MGRVDGFPCVWVDGLLVEQQFRKGIVKQGEIAAEIKEGLEDVVAEHEVVHLAVDALPFGVVGIEGGEFFFEGLAHLFFCSGGTAAY